jgi:hypothetical protein
MRQRQVLVSVAHAKNFYACAMYETSFDKRWMFAGNINVLLRFDFTTKLA